MALLCGNVFLNIGFTGVLLVSVTTEAHHVTYPVELFQTFATEMVSE